MSDVTSVLYLQAPADMKGGNFRVWDANVYDWSLRNATVQPAPTQKVLIKARMVELGARLALLCCSCLPGPALQAAAWGLWRAAPVFLARLHVLHPVLSLLWAVGIRNTPCVAVPVQNMLVDFVIPQGLATRHYTPFLATLVQENALVELVIPIAWLRAIVPQFWLCRCRRTRWCSSAGTPCTASTPSPRSRGCRASAWSCAATRSRRRTMRSRQSSTCLARGPELMLMKSWVGLFMRCNCGPGAGPGAHSVVVTCQALVRGLVRECAARQSWRARPSWGHRAYASWRCTAEHGPRICVHRRSCPVERGAVRHAPLPSSACFVG